MIKRNKSANLCFDKLRLAIAPDIFELKDTENST